MGKSKKSSKALVKSLGSKTVAKKKKKKKSKKGKKIFSANTRSLPNVQTSGGHYVGMDASGQRVVMGAKAPRNAPMNPVQLLRFMATQNYASISAKKKKDDLLHKI